MQGLPTNEPEENRLDNKEKTKKALQWMKFFNIFTSIILIVLSAFSLVGVIIRVMTSFKIFLVFSPFFMVLFGICLFASEFKIRYVLKKVPFLKNMLGRGLFYLYLSSVIYYYFDNNQDTLMAWISALTLFISGVVYIAIHFGYAKDLKREDLEEQYEETYKERLV